MITNLRIYRVLSVLPVLLAIALPQGVSHALQPTTQPVVIVVRDCAGNPMMGVPLKIYIDVPPQFEEHDQCVTGQDGACTVHLLPNTYRVRFMQGWRGRLFIPVEEQQAFGLTVGQSDQVQYLTLAVAERDGMLVPVWDMSRDPGQPPEPFLPSFASPDGDPLAALNLGPLVEDAAGPPAVAATPTPQTVVDRVEPGGPAEPPLEIPVATPEPEPVADLGSDVILRGIIALAVALLLAILLLAGFMLLSRRAGARKG